MLRPKSPVRMCTLSKLEVIRNRLSMEEIDRNFGTSGSGRPEKAKIGISAGRAFSGRGPPSWRAEDMDAGVVGGGRKQRRTVACLRVYYGHGKT
jgi:hypothetical protein